MSPVLIDKARERHLAAIPGIELAGVTLFSETDLPQHIRHRVTAIEDLREALEDGRLWTACEADHVVGFALADVVDGQAYLTEVDVLPDYGRQGIGSRLVETVVNWARDGGFSSLSLLTFRHLAWNAPFYEKLGFRPIAAAEHGPEIEGLMSDEADIGIDRSMRVAMRLKL
jgi:GNAT superfamily N-acetyltransferase